MRFRILAASLLLAGCSSSTPPTYALSPWGFAVKECEAYDPGYASIDCQAGDGLADSVYTGAMQSRLG